MIAHLEALDELELANFVGDTKRSQSLERVVAFAERTREEEWRAAVAHEDNHRALLAA